jgi:hypothetical protein
MSASIKMDFCCQLDCLELGFQENEDIVSLRPPISSIRLFL